MPNSLVAEVHDRMPAILDPDDYERWLDPGISKPEVILDCLRPFDATGMSKYPVSPRGASRELGADTFLTLWSSGNLLHFLQSALTLHRLLAM
jgi:putative SOS response-associated peptidase YedK